MGYVDLKRKGDLFFTNVGGGEGLFWHLVIFYMICSGDCWNPILELF